MEAAVDEELGSACRRHAPAMAECSIEVAIAAKECECVTELARVRYARRAQGLGFMTEGDSAGRNPVISSKYHLGITSVDAGYRVSINRKRTWRTPVNASEDDEGHNRVWRNERNVDAGLLSSLWVVLFPSRLREHGNCLPPGSGNPALMCSSLGA